MIWNNEELCRQYIQSCNIQGLFSTPVLGEICLHRFARGENIYREGEPLRELYFLVKGQVKVFRTHHNGKVSVVEFASAFDILGELELVNARDTTISVQALRDCHWPGLSLAPLLSPLPRDDTFTTSVALRPPATLRRLPHHPALNTSYSVEVRLARYIHYTRRGDMFEERLTEAAEYLGVSYRHLQRIIAKFCADGLLERVRGGYRVCEPERIEDLYKRTL